MCHGAVGGYTSPGRRSRPYQAPPQLTVFLHAVCTALSSMKNGSLMIDKLLRRVRVPAALMRGGTSKGLVFRGSDLPETGSAARDSVILAAMAPDASGLAVNGVGGGVTSTLKVGVVSPPEARPDLGVDFDYHFGQVSPMGPSSIRPTIDWGSNCGNFAAAAALFAVSEGLVKLRSDGSAVARMWSVGAAEQLEVHIPSAETPPIAVPGVPGVGLPLQVDFVGLNNADSPLFPTGRLVDEELPMGRRKVSATLVHAGNPMVLIAAADGHLDGAETAAAASRAIAFDEVDTLLDAAAERMGLRTRPSGMRVLWLSSSRDHALLEGQRVAASECDILSRVSAGNRIHHAHTGTGSIALACAAAVPGTVAHAIAAGSRSGSGDDSKGGSSSNSTIRIAHPQGVVSVSASVERCSLSGQYMACRARFLRTARFLMIGDVILP